MKKTIQIVLCVLALLSQTGCAALLVGVGAGVSAYTYVNGELSRPYATEYDTAIWVSSSAAKAFKIEIKSKENDGITCLMKGVRVDDTPVTIKVKIIGPRVSEVGVRVGRVGFWNKNVAKLIHEHIAKKI